MPRHGLSPDGMLFGAMYLFLMVDVQTCLIHRAIILSSILCKILDVVILTKESDNLCCSNLQFSFKPGASTSLCTSMVQETISYYVNNGSNVYSLMLDASKAFDIVNYCQLFRILLEKKHLSSIL